MMSKEIENGGFAFPCDSMNKQFPTQEGMTLRDYFAAQCLSGLCSLGKNLENPDAMVDWTQADVVAVAAYEIADAMLQSRKVGP
jgi:hypothetical protein